MVFPIPRSSFIAGITILTFRFSHSRKQYKNKEVKRVLKKIILKNKRKEGVKTPYVVIFVCV